MSEEEKMTLKEFKENYEYNDSYSKPFTELFDITCKKCGSADIEIFGIYDSGGCYYSGDEPNISQLIKCHNCGCAKVFRREYYGVEVLK